MSIYILSTGLLALLLCTSINSLPRRTDSTEFHTDLDGSYLVSRSDSTPTLSSTKTAGEKNGILEDEPEFMLVTPKRNPDPRSGLRFPASASKTEFGKKSGASERLSLKRLPRAIEEEGSGQFEDTTTTAAPATTTTTTAAPATAAPATEAPATAAPATTTTTTAAPATTTTTTIATTTTAAASVVNTPRYLVALNVVLRQVYTPDYSNTQSAAYQSLTVSIISWATPIYQNKYGSRFYRVVIIALRPVTRFRQDNTEVELEVEFDQRVPEEQPESAEVAEQLKLEASTNNPVDVVTDSISVLRSPKTTTNARFTTINETFSITLATLNSTSYRERTSRMKSELEPFFQEDYSTDFLSLTPTTYTAGTIYSDSIVTYSELSFTYNATVPSDVAIYNTMVRAAQSGNLTFTIITVNGTDINASSGVNTINFNFLTTFSLTFLSVLLTRAW